jgi:pyrophosphatase PpaX
LNAEKRECSTMAVYDLPKVETWVRFPSLAHMPNGLRTIRAVLFDMDGTLLDTREYIYQSFEHTFQAHGLNHLSRKDLPKLKGMSLEESYRALVPEHNVENLRDTHRAFQRENIDLVRPFPNTLMTLMKLRSAGIKMAIVSTRAKTARESLEHTGLLDWFEVIITGDDTTNFKPHPEGIFKALEKIGAPTTEAMMVGDTDADILAGKNAQTISVGATYGFTPRDVLQTLNPDYLIDDIQEVLELV